jgi:Ca-activated chloride channel family protein
MIDYKRQLDNYMKLTTLNNSHEQLNSPIQDQNPFMAQQQQQQQQQQNPISYMNYNQIQQQQQEQQQQFQNNRNQTNKTNEKKEEFFQKFGSKYEEHKNKLKQDLHQEYNEYLQKVS